jgi:hypothetical protein
MMLRQVPHSDMTDREIRDMLKNDEGEPLRDGQIHIIRGERGRPNLFIGLSVSDVSLERATALAPTFLEKASALVAEKASRV